MSELVLIRPLLPITLKMFHRLATSWEGGKLWLAGRYGRYGKLKLNLALELLTIFKNCLNHVFFSGTYSAPSKVRTVLLS